MEAFTMKYRKIGKFGVKLSAFGLGNWVTMGFKVDDSVSRDIIHKAYESGINYFDTADVYARGEAERIYGDYLSEFPRHTLFILTKTFWPMSDEINDRGLSAKHIFESCHKSLKRLKTDYIDCYMCHRPDPDTPLEETICALEDLARQGKILYWGVSEWPDHLMVRANSLARQLGARPIAVNQPRYSLLYRYPERNQFPATRAEGIGNVIFSPLAHGLLTGKYKPGEAPPAGTRLADPDKKVMVLARYDTDENKSKGLELARIASEMGITAARLALAWCLRNPAVTSVIIGATRVSQLEENLKALDVEIPEEILEKLESLYPPPDRVDVEG
jgi:aryl-alcohol dehydrogenase-like predicted oxidoreductase